MAAMDTEPDECKRPRVDVVIPCLNEVAILRSTVERTLATCEQHPGYDWHVVIADNGSDDGTGELAREMEAEGLPPESAETIRTGWWTTCLENLPARERARGKF